MIDPAACCAGRYAGSCAAPVSAKHHSTSHSSHRGGPGLRIVLALAALLPACQGNPTRTTNFDPARVEAEVLQALHSFEETERLLSPEALLAFLGPGFTMLQDGRRVSNAATLEQIRETLPTLRAFEPRFEEVEVLALAPDAAITSMIFHDTITGQDGQTVRMWGPSTLVWRKVDDVWQIVFADSDHYPEAQ